MRNRSANKPHKVQPDPWGSPVHGHLLGATAMNHAEFQKTYRDQTVRNKNHSMRYFDSLDAYCQLSVISRANQIARDTFKISDIGLPFKGFTEQQRWLLIQAMNELSQMGKAMPQYFSTADRFINE